MSYPHLISFYCDCLHVSKSELKTIVHSFVLFEGWQQIFGITYCLRWFQDVWKERSCLVWFDSPQIKAQRNESRQSCYTDDQRDSSHWPGLFPFQLLSCCFTKFCKFVCPTQDFMFTICSRVVLPIFQLHYCEDSWTVVRSHKSPWGSFSPSRVRPQTPWRTCSRSWGCRRSRPIASL